MKEKDSRFIVCSCIVVVFDCWLLLFSFNCHLGSWFHFYLLYSANIIFVIHSFLIKFRNNRANVRLDNVQNGFNDNEKIKTNIKGKWGYIPIIVQLIESFNYWYGIYIVSFLQVIYSFSPHLELCLASGVGSWKMNRFDWIFSRFRIGLCSFCISIFHPLEFFFDFPCFLTYVSIWSPHRFWRFSHVIPVKSIFGMLTNFPFSALNFGCLLRFALIWRNEKL